MSKRGVFPFGRPVRAVSQVDCTPKRVFVLGVYASAVHARWVNHEGKLLISALGVASEPEIFWRGENAAKIIASIKIPKQAGRLEVPGGGLNEKWTPDFGQYVKVVPST